MYSACLIPLKRLDILLSLQIIIPRLKYNDTRHELPPELRHIPSTPFSDVVFTLRLPYSPLSVS
jgi:hypothetical protein